MTCLGSYGLHIKSSIDRAKCRLIGSKRGFKFSKDVVKQHRLQMTAREDQLLCTELRLEPYELGQVDHLRVSDTD